MLPQVFEAGFAFLNGGNVAGGNPPQDQVGAVARFKPLLAPAEDGGMARTIGLGVQGLEAGCGHLLPPLPHNLPLANPDQVEQPIQPHVRDGAAGALAHDGLGVEGDAQPGRAQHGQVVGAVAHGDCLLQR